MFRSLIQMTLTSLETAMRTETEPEPSQSNPSSSARLGR